MSKLIIEQCPETGICSILKDDGVKIDLMPDEAMEIRNAGGNPDKIKNVLTEVDSSFAEMLNDDEVAEISSEIK